MWVPQINPASRVRRIRRERIRTTEGRPRAKRGASIMDDASISRPWADETICGEVSERSKEHAWKVCKRLNPASRVRIPLSPPHTRSAPQGAFCVCDGKTANPLGSTNWQDSQCGQPQAARAQRGRGTWMCRVHPASNTGAALLNFRAHRFRGASMVAPSAPRDASSKTPPGPEGSNGIE